ncbi:glycosyl transferase, group 1 [Shewanella denitrificans OS217]|uniref:Glycosyl transferase, group 1 n=1 Tax=Shewanella denitrificans (strain OS217 / ATCC BAA-1090 / DSM 15013) TaxID=318161 RepID=Q12KU7_SHEDO|nr:glycosyltransferase family 4 protein [Shewanella denitrificans]ABE55929.1 glycosyl transferase, group 1 [Shewanella denitrificans OS217]
MEFKVVVFSRYGRLGASSRLRFFQYYKYVNSLFGSVVTYPLFDDEYLTDLYSHGVRRKSKVIYSYVKRLFQIITIHKYDVVIIEKELFPYFPATIERLLNFFNVKYVVDYDDAIFQMYEESSNWMVKFFLKDKINVVMNNAHIVITGNDFLFSKAKFYGAKNVTVIPTVIDIDRYVQESTRQEVPTVCWIGSPSTQKYVVELKDVLIRVCLENKAKLVLVGATTSVGDFFPDIDLEIIPWEESTEAFIIKHSDIGIMPIASTNWERGKCGYKLIQYMATGKPVVASNFGANIDIVKNECCGLLVNSDDEWYEALTQLIKDRQLSLKLGASGRERVENIYCIQAQYKQFLKVLRSSVN